MNAPRIVFMGTPEFAVAILNELIENQFEIVGVITAPDKPAGRGLKVHESAVKKYAVNKGLTILQPKNLKNEDFLKELRGLKADLQIIVAFRMLPEVVWSMPLLGTFNLHASLLPEYRGAAPINWAIIKGEKETGVTTFFIDEHIDTGEIILQESIKIDDKETAGTLHDKLMYLGASVVVKTVKLIACGEAKRQKQPIKTPKKAPKIYKHHCEIDWNQPLASLGNFIRGLDPYPGAWTTMNNLDEKYKMKIFTVDKEEIDHNYAIGKIFASKGELKVAVSGGYLIIQKLQIAGKRKLPAKDFLNGFHIDKEAYLA